MTAPSAGRDDATVRGAVVLVVAIVIGVALLLRGGSGGGGDDEAADGAPSTETTAATEATGEGESTTVPIATSSTTTAPAADPASITVAVLNATPQGGWAAENAGTIAAGGYQTTEGNFGGEDVETSQIYATPEAQAAAQAVAELLELEVQVAEKPGEPLGDEGQDAEADVVVVLGADSLQ
jgi:hypothetical protein